jgi:hypothetical protein
MSVCELACVAQRADVHALTLSWYNVCNLSTHALLFGSTTWCLQTGLLNLLSADGIPYGRFTTGGSFKRVWVCDAP